MTTRRDIITSGLGLAGIIAAGRAPAALVRSMVAARAAAMGGSAEPTNPYQTSDNACIFMLDADYGLSDVCGGHSLTVDGDISIENHAFVFSGTQSIKIDSPNDILSSLNTNALSLQMVFGGDMTGAIIGLGLSPRGIWVFRSGAKLVANYRDSLNAQLQGILDYNPTKLTIINGVFSWPDGQLVKTGTFVAEGECYIGKAMYLTKSVMTLNSIRIYNRHLTEEELTRFSATDLSRFGIA